MEKEPASIVAAVLIQSNMFIWKTKIPRSLDPGMKECADPDYSKEANIWRR